jgi:hypothetical protein
MKETVRADAHKGTLWLNRSGHQARAQGNERRTPGGNGMSCERCGGLMVIETSCDLMEDGSRIGIDTARCLNCGNFEDRIIRTNRVISRLPRHIEPHTVGTRRPGVIQPRSFERAISMDGVIPESPPGRSPRLPVGTPSAKTRRLEPEHLEQPTRIVQTQRRYA